MGFSEWKEHKLSEIMDIFGGGTPKTSVVEYWNGEIPWLSVKDFNSDNRTVNETEKSITELGLKKSSTRLLDKGDLIVSARGTVGELAQLGRPMAFNQSCYGLRANSLTINDYLYYLLKYKIKDIQQNTHGSVFDTITRDTFEILTALLPENIQEQKAIARILSTLDDKIEVNNRINKTLESMAQEIFKRWFVDFEFPDENGDPYKSSGGEMVESELGMIPEGWSSVELGSYINIKHGYAFKSEYFTDEESNRILLTPGNFKIGGGFQNRKFKYYSAEGEIKDEYILKNNDLIITMTDLSKNGDTLGYPALVPMIKDKVMLHNQRLGKIENNILPRCFIYRLMCSEGYRNYILATSTGTTVRHTAPNRIMGYRFALPKYIDNILIKFDYVIDRFMIKSHDVINENICLQNIRDMLLSKLMSGEIRVPIVDTERQ